MSSRIVCRRKLTRPRIDCRIATCLRLGHAAKNSAQALFFAACPPGRDRSLLLQYTLWLFYFASLIKQLAGFSNPSRTHSRARATFHFVTCPPGRDRTFDRRLKRPLLYQLSYGRGLRECTMQFPSKQARNPPKNKCREWDSNPHELFTPGILSPLCLPFHHLGLGMMIAESSKLRELVPRAQNDTV